MNGRFLDSAPFSSQVKAGLTDQPIVGVCLSMDISNDVYRS